MKKTSKKLLCVLLSLVLLLTTAALAFAETGKEEKTPIVLIPGFGQSETKVYDGDEYLGMINAFELPGLNVENILKKVLAPGLASILTRSDLHLSKAVKEVVDDLFKAFKTNPDGTPVYERIVTPNDAAFSDLPPEKQAEVQHHIAIHGLEDYNDVRYYYAYDSFGSIKQVSDGLHRFLTEIVLPQTGAEKVMLVPVSQGGTVLTQYLYDYPDDIKYIEKIVAVIPAFDGAQILGDVMTDNVKIYDVNYDHETVLPALLPGDLGYQVSLALRAALPARVTEKVLREALEEVRQLLVVNSSMMWALCPAADYAVAKDKYLGDEAHAKVRAECDAYDAARRALPGTLQQLLADGMQIHIVSCYGTGNIMPVLFGSGNVNSDELLTPYSSGLGATFANIGETLGDGYTAKGTVCSDPAHNHLSPDGMIDASTCALPENTWFFKGVGHTYMNFREDIKNFAARLILEDVKDIYSLPPYSQFNDPSLEVARSEVVNGYVYHYDKNGRFLYSEPAPAESNASPFWKGLAGIVNKLYRSFDAIKAALHLDKLKLPA
ncbi:MAG: hypothetical protein IJL00_01840 [Clostridia bacterium]|nr:hypothetical protein [Clostridia bacterium]